MAEHGYTNHKRKKPPECIKPKPQPTIAPSREVGVRTEASDYREKMKTAGIVKERVGTSDNHFNEMLSYDEDGNDCQRVDSFKMVMVSERVDHGIDAGTGIKYFNHPIQPEPREQPELNDPNWRDILLSEKDSNDSLTNESAALQQNMEALKGTVSPSGSDDSAISSMVSASSSSHETESVTSNDSGISL